MLTDLRQRSQTEFQKAIAVIYELMSQPDTELASIPAFSRYNCFVRASEDQRSLAQALCEHFKGIHQNALPACSTFTARSNHAEVRGWMPKLYVCKV